MCSLPGPVRPTVLDGCLCNPERDGDVSPSRVAILTPGDTLAASIGCSRDEGRVAVRAEARWLAVGNDGWTTIEPGSVVVVTEGPRPVAYSYVARVVGLVAGSSP
jgi:hypothetical protein